MFGSSLSALGLAVIAGVAAFFTWSSHRGASIVLGVVCVIAAFVAVLMAFLGTLALAFKLLPLVVLAFGVWWVWRALSKR